MARIICSPAQSRKGSCAHAFALLKKLFLDNVGAYDDDLRDHESNRASVYIDKKRKGKKLISKRIKNRIKSGDDIYNSPSHALFFYPRNRNKDSISVLPVIG